MWRTITNTVGNLVIPMCEELILMQLLIIFVKRYFNMCISLAMYMYDYDNHFYHHLCIISVFILSFLIGSLMNS